MPGFSFSPSLRNHDVMLLLKNGTKLSGKVTEVNPAEVAVLLPNEHRVVRVNRDEVSAYTGQDEHTRSPVSPTLCVTRCCNVVMRCNGIKRIDQQQREPTNCPLYNEHCEVYTGDFFSMSRSAQIKLLSGAQLNKFPTHQGDNQ